MKETSDGRRAAQLQQPQQLCRQQTKAAAKAAGAAGAAGQQEQQQQQQEQQQQQPVRIFKQLVRLVHSTPSSSVSVRRLAVPRGDRRWAGAAALARHGLASALSSEEVQISQRGRDRGIAYDIHRKFCWIGPQRA